MSHADPYYYDAHGDRPQKTGYRTKAEAREALQEALRQMRLGALHRPRVPLRQLTEAFLDQHQAAPSTLVGLRQNMRPARHVLQAAMRWKWIEDNPATLVKNPTPKPGEIHPFESWDDRRGFRALVIFLAGTGVRPEEGFGTEWPGVDVKRRVWMVRRALAKGRLKEYGKTNGSRRAVPLRARVVVRLERLPHQRGILFPAPGGGRIEINNFRHRQWTPALAAAGIEHRRIYDLRHTGASRPAWTSSRSRGMGTSVKMIDQTYGHLITGADVHERELLDAFDQGAAGPFGHALDTEDEADAA